jgi:hypothetical protein
LPNKVKPVDIPLLQNAVTLALDIYSPAPPFQLFLLNPTLTMGFFSKKEKPESTLPSYQAQTTNTAEFEALKGTIEDTENEIWPDEVTKGIALRYQESLGIQHVRTTDPKVRSIPPC